jgi:hypothetical protein
MGGSRQPGPWGWEASANSIDEGTMSLVRTPAPGSLRDDPRWTVAPQKVSSLDDVRNAIAEFRSSDSWASLQPIVFSIVGPETFGLGVVVGMGENVLSGALGLAEIAKTFLLADLYDRAQQPVAMSLIGPLGFFHRAIAELSMRAFGAELQQARDDRDTLIRELTYAMTHPGEVFDNVKADYTKKWKTFEQLVQQPRLSSQFGAGRIFGEVLVDVLALIGAGAAAIKGASKIPRLVKLAKMKRPLMTTAAEPPVVRPPTSTPSQLRAPDPPPAAPLAKPAAQAQATPPQSVPPPKPLAIPKVSDPKLANLVNDLYKGAKTKNPIGTGSTADAVRHELATGQPTGGRFHSDKAQQYVNALNNWLKRAPDASHYDRMVAESLKRDLESALAGN